MSTFLRDIRYAVRVLRGAPLFTCTAVLILLLGIGATAAIFSLVDATLIRPLPFRQPEQLVMLSERSPSTLRNQVASQNYLDWVEQNRSFRSISGASGPVFVPLADSADGVPETVSVLDVTPEFFDTLQVQPLAGRTFNADDISGANGAPGIVISESLWTIRFGRDPRLVERTVRFGSTGRQARVLGVVPANAQVGARADVWELLPPLRGLPDGRRLRFLQAIGRLRPGVDIDAARADMNVVAGRITEVAPDTNRGWSVTIDPLQPAIVGEDLRATTLVLAGVVGILLLLACANVANLLVAHALARTREIAVRCALGASRLRVMRQLLTQGAVLALLGGGLGLALAAGLLRIALIIAPAGAIPDSVAPAIDWRLTVFSLALTAATIFLFGLIPGWNVTRVSLVETLNSGGRGVSGAGGRLRQALVIVQVALALVLLAGAGLLTRTFLSLAAVEKGYSGENVVTMRLGVGVFRFRSQRDLSGYFERIKQEVATVPGVQLASFVSSLPLEGQRLRQSFEIVGEPARDPANRPTAHYQIASPEYFDAIGIQIRQGRGFTDTDTDSAPPVCIVNEEFARRHLGGRNPIGTRISVPTVTVPPRPTVREIVGVIRQVRTRPDEQDAAVEIYVPLAQNANAIATLVVRTAAAPGPLVPVIKSAIARVDRNQAPASVRTIADVATEATGRPRFRAELVGGFAAVAVILALVGITAVLTVTVQQRQRDYSTRMAIGASAGDILRLILGGALRVVLAGLAIGVITAAVLARALRTLVFGVGPFDPITFVLAPIILVAIAMGVCAWPAFRATRVNLSSTLRPD